MARQTLKPNGCIFMTTFLFFTHLALHSDFVHRLGSLVVPNFCWPLPLCHVNQNQCPPAGGLYFPNVLSVTTAWRAPADALAPLESHMVRKQWFSLRPSRSLRWEASVTWLWCGHRKGMLTALHFSAPSPVLGYSKPLHLLSEGRIISCIHVNLQRVFRKQMCVKCIFPS